MEKMEIEEVVACSWECPKCSTHNLTEKYSRLICDNFYEEYNVKGED